MQKITYKDILYFKKCLLIEKTFLNDNSAEYKIPNKKVNQPHDKTIKTILEKNKEAAHLINKALKLKQKGLEIKPKDIEKYNRKFITKEFKNSEADIIYKMKNKEVFFLIEHQSKVDYSMPYRIMKYSIELIENRIDTEKINTQGYRYPSIYPIIIYTGKEKWNVDKKFEKLQENLYETEKIEFTQYNLVDINLISKQELIEDKSFLSKIFLIEKSKTEEEIVNSLETIIESGLSGEEKDFIKRLIYYILKEKISIGKIEELLEKLKEREELNMRWMDILADSINKKYEDAINKGLQEGRKEGRKEGRQEGILTTAKKMIKKNMQIKDIQEITGLSKEEIEKLANNET